MRTHLKPQSTALATRLGYLRLRYWMGLLLCILMRLLWAMAAVLLVYVVADFFLAFSPGTRRFLNMALPALLLLWAAMWLFRNGRLTLADVAARADRVGQDSRRSLLSAWELSREGETGDAFTQYLVEQVVDEADRKMGELPLTARLPVDLMKRHALRAGWVTVLVLLALTAVMPVSKVILPRLMNPDADHPPYSRYRFDVDPEYPSVLYGGSVELQVEISGPKVTDAVWMMTRQGERVHRSACFQMEGRRYAQRLDQLTDPVEFCFAIGRARSVWHQMDIQLMPKISVARLRVTPPAYCRKPAYSFIAGDHALQELKGASIELDVTSNRPLSEGRMVITSMDGERTLHEVAAQKTGNANAALLLDTE